MSIRVLVCDDDPIVRDALSGYLRTAEEIEVTATAGTAEEALAFLTDAEAAAPPSLEDPAAAPRADVVLMDLAMPGMGGIAGARSILRDHPGLAVIMLTTFGTDDQVREAIASGASGFLLKSATAATLVAAVRAASSGAGVVITPQVAASLAAEPGRTGSAAGPVAGAAGPAGSGVGPAGSAAASGGGADAGPAVPAGPVHSAAPADSPGPAAPGAAGSDPTRTAASEPSIPGPEGGAAPLVTERELEVLHLLCRADTNTQIAAQLMLSESTVKKHVTSLMAKLGCTSRLQIAVRAFELGLAEPPAPRP